MRTFISILFVFVFVLAGKCQEHCNIKSYDDKGNHILENNIPVSQIIDYSYVFNEQDSDDIDEPGASYIVNVSRLKSVNWKIKSNQFFFLGFDQIQFNKLLIDLPPPTSC